jgi:hypothetical protein
MSSFATDKTREGFIAHVEDKIKKKSAKNTATNKRMIIAMTEESTLDSLTVTVIKHFKGK